jgi:hypothetical protein
MTIIIYARSNDEHNHWSDLKTTGFDEHGKDFVGKELDHHTDVAVLVVPDNEAPPEQFLSPEHLFTHAGGPNDQKERARFVGDEDRFSHIPNTPIYETLKSLLSKDDPSLKAIVIKDLRESVGANREHSALLRLCMIEQIEVLCPGEHHEGVRAARDGIRLSGYGAALLVENARRIGTGESFSNFLDRKLKEANRSS